MRSFSFAPSVRAPREGPERGFEFNRAKLAVLWPVKSDSYLFATVVLRSVLQSISAPHYRSRHALRKGAVMRIDRKRYVMALLLVIVLAPVSFAVGQAPKSLVASANGEGTIKLGKEEFKIYAVVVKLFEDGKAEINLVTDITIFINGTWSRRDEADKTIDLKITGGSVSGNLDGGGKISLNDDRKSIKGLKLQVVNKTTDKVIKADFVAK